MGCARPRHRLAPKPTAPLTRSARARVLDRAVIAWRVGKPHRAWEILAEAGMSDYWARFQRTALQHARRGYTRAMERYVA
jgi:hypothetical protein